MSAKEGGQVAVVLTEERPSFLDSKIDLKTLLLALKRESKGALDALIKILTDEKSDPKLRLQAAKTILELQVSVASEISRDQMQRLVAEIKLNPTGRKSMTAIEDDDGEELPLVDFENIRQL